MTVKELIKILDGVDPDLRVFCTSNTGEFEYGLVHSAGTNFIVIDDEGEEEQLVFVIDEQ